MTTQRRIVWACVALLGLGIWAVAALFYGREPHFDFVLMFMAIVGAILCVGGFIEAMHAWDLVDEGEKG